MELIEAVQGDNVALVKEVLASGANVNEEDKYGWTPLNWAAGRGNVEIVKTLFHAGADLFKVGIDQRTALMIALAAGHREAATFLGEAESRTGKNDRLPERKYCMAYRRSALRSFPGWSEKKIEKNGQHETELTDQSILYLHQDYAVTKSIVRAEEVIFEDVTPEWKEFCSVSLKFKVPDDLDLICLPPSTPLDGPPTKGINAS